MHCAVLMYCVLCYQEFKPYCREAYLNNVGKVCYMFSTSATLLSWRAPLLCSNATIIMILPDALPVRLSPLPSPRVYPPLALCNCLCGTDMGPRFLGYSATRAV